MDTPPQKFCHFGECDCDGKKCDTCLEDELADPVHNYMGYNDDACLNELTLGQISRIYKATYFHRPQYMRNDYVEIL